MNKITLTTFAFFLFSLTLFSKEKNISQEPLSIHKGNVTLSGAYGFPSILRAFLKLKTTRDKISVMGVGPVMFKVDYMITNKWSIGVNAAYNFSRLSWMDAGYDTIIHGNRPYEYGIEAEEISATLRGNYHFKKTQKIDAYAGIGFGYGRLSLGTYTEAPLNQFSVGYSLPKPLSFEGTVGCRYYLTKNIGVYGEFGLGKSWLLFRKYFLPEAVIQAGINLKL
jgi:opacity protein-like surface antigen